MDYFEIAQEVIENFIRSRNDWSHLTNLRWMDKTPKTDLLFQLPAWITELNSIIDQYNDKIDVQISLRPIEKRNSYVLTLGMLWLLLIRLAETKTKVTIIKAFRA